jgi:RHS repeat-associated protein
MCSRVSTASRHSMLRGAVVDSYLFDGIDQPLGIEAMSTTAYYELDLAGNVRGLRASGGASLGDYRYSAFGQTLEDTSSIDQPLRWKGRWFSPVAGGTYDVRARQWSPELGVFLTVDEFEFHSPTTTLWGWRAMNPISWADPTGDKEAPLTCHEVCEQTKWDKIILQCRKESTYAKRWKCEDDAITAAKTCHDGCPPTPPPPPPAPPGPVPMPACQ